MIKEIFESEPQVIEKEFEKFVVVGDLHGDYGSLVKVLKNFGKLPLVFLGDYVDRGERQLETVDLIFRLKKNRKDVVVLRGNHETAVSRIYGFEEEAKDKYNEYLEVFSQMPYACIINSFLLLHGGLPRKGNLDDIRRIPKGLPLETPDENQVAFDVLWNDPAEFITGFVPSHRGAYLFGCDVTESFLERHELKALIRGHEPYPLGGNELHNGLVKTVFTCSLYPTTAPYVAVVKKDKVEYYKV